MSIIDNRLCCLNRRTSGGARDLCRTNVMRTGPHGSCMSLHISSIVTLSARRSTSAYVASWEIRAGVFPYAKRWRHTHMHRYLSIHMSVCMRACLRCSDRGASSLTVAACGSPRFVGSVIVWHCITSGVQTSRCARVCVLLRQLNQRGNSSFIHRVGALRVTEAL